VRSVVFDPGRVVVTVALRRRRLVCPKCEFSTPNRVSRQHHDSFWRHLNLGVWRLELRARLRRVRCPEHGALVEGVPFARDGAGFTRDMEDLVAWLATRTDTTAITRLVRIDWQTVGRIVERVGDELLDGDRLSDLFEVSIDEVAWRKWFACNSIWIYDVTHFKRCPKTAVITVMDLVTRKWICEVVSAEETGTQVQVASPKRRASRRCPGASRTSRRSKGQWGGARRDRWTRSWEMWSAGSRLTP
jgi:transposase